MSVLSPYIIPFFIPHAGCPHQCVFCNQAEISGRNQPVAPEEVGQQIIHTLARRRDHQRPVQVAFYGGSFTGLDLLAQRRLLGAVQPFIQSGEVAGIRLSTRPDCLDDIRLELLVESGVTLVELGVQSLDTMVLQRSGRGHSVGQVVEAFRLLRQYGLQVGGQVMVGLPGDSPARSVQTCKTLILLKPDCVRIYPTLVMNHTPLQGLYETGQFQPWSLGKTVVVVAKMKELFAGAGVAVIRMGLQAGESLEENLLAGPYHPAFGELVLSRLFFKAVRHAIFRARAWGGGGLRLTISPRDRSLFMGMAKENYQRLQRGGWLEGVELHVDGGQPRFTVQCNP